MRVSAKQARETASRLRLAAAVAHPESPNSADVRLNSENGAIARRCACRGWIVGPEALPGNTEILAAAVQTHQNEEPHNSWDREAWVEANTTTDPVQTVIRRVA